MNPALVCLLFGAALAATFAGILIHTFRPDRRDRVEAPKYRMLGDDPAGPGGDREG